MFLGLSLLASKVKVLPFENGTPTVLSQIGEAIYGAETTLRGLPGVRQVKGVKREEDWAEFTLEVDPSTDLIKQMKAAMPVAFEVIESTSDSVSLKLKWAWGAS